MKAKRITITARGEDDSDLEMAVAEALRAVNEGYLSGHNSNDTGAYYFNVSEDVPARELPA